MRAHRAEIVARAAVVVSMPLRRPRIIPSAPCTTRSSTSPVRQARRPAQRRSCDRRARRLRSGLQLLLRRRLPLVSQRSRTRGRRGRSRSGARRLVAPLPHRDLVAALAASEKRAARQTLRELEVSGEQIVLREILDGDPADVGKAEVARFAIDAVDQEEGEIDLEISFRVAAARARFRTRSRRRALPAAPAAGRQRCSRRAPPCRRGTPTCRDGDRSPASGKGARDRRGR